MSGSKTMRVRIEVNATDEQRVTATVDFVKRLDLFGTRYNF